MDFLCDKFRDKYTLMSRLFLSFFLRSSLAGRYDCKEDSLIMSHHACYFFFKQNENFLDDGSKLKIIATFVCFTYLVYK